MSNQQHEAPGGGVISVAVNGEEHRVPSGLNIGRLLEVLGIKGDRVAVELNRVIVRKTDWEGTRVEAGAKLEIVTFVGGG